MKVNNAIGGSKNSNSDRDLSYRDLILKIISSLDCPINIRSFDEKEGKIVFSVSLECMEMPYEYIISHKNRLFCNFMANFMGEFFIRENMNKFAEIVTNLEFEKYNTAVSGKEHRNFGLDYINGSLVFAFHVSLIQSILFENIKNKIKSIS